MKIEFTIDTPEKIDVVIERDPFSGRFTCTANGQPQAVKPVARPGAGFSFEIKETFAVEVGTTEKQVITIEHRGPLLFAAVKPHAYTVTVGGKVVGEYRGL